jgi:release factor glutamine methyltransferase
LAYYIKNCEVEAFDVSLRAVRVCRINQKKLGLHNYTVSQQDLFQPWEKVRGKYHIVVSNPPYIPRKHIDHLQWEVSIHEPRLALDGGVTGLDYYERIIQTYSEVATEKSVLAFEFGWDQKNKVMALMEKEGQFEEYEQIKDLQGLDRGVIGYRR